jgi:hypothetical protein
MAAPTVASLTLSPSVIEGGGGGFSAGTVMLSEPAPAGGAEVLLSSSNTELAASVGSVHIPAGADSATFQIGTNKSYRRYSRLAFEVVVSAFLGGSRQSAVLSVTAPRQPPDVPSDSNQREGLMCGARIPASAGEAGILYDCALPPNFGTVGECTFQQECLSFGCQTVPANGFQFSDVCADTGVYPIDLTPPLVVRRPPAPHREGGGRRDLGRERLRQRQRRGRRRRRHHRARRGRPGAALLVPQRAGEDVDGQGSHGHSVRLIQRCDGDSVRPGGSDNHPQREHDLRGKP